MAFIDSHAHLADSAFDGDRADVIARARAVGASDIVCIGESVAAAERAREIAVVNRGFVHFTAGVHPHDATSFVASRDLVSLGALCDAGAVAIGECGLDYHYDNSPREVQRAAFAAQLVLAADRGLPVVVHTRDAEADTHAMVVEAGAAGVRGVLHCFTGTELLAAAAIEAGWYVSFSGIVTFKRWTGDAVIRLVPDDRLLVESDAPYLAPVPFRGTRNEPAHVPLTAARVAAARGRSAESIAELTATNARRLFGLAGMTPRG